MGRGWEAQVQVAAGLLQERPVVPERGFHRPSHKPSRSPVQESSCSRSVRWISAQVRSDNPGIRQVQGFQTGGTGFSARSAPGCLRGMGLSVGHPARGQAQQALRPSPPRQTRTIRSSRVAFADTLLVGQSLDEQQPTPRMVRILIVRRFPWNRFRSQAQAQAQAAFVSGRGSARLRSRGADPAGARCYSAAVSRPSPHHRLARTPDPSLDTTAPTVSPSPRTCTRDVSAEASPPTAPT